jgi:hypothetical protein
MEKQAYALVKALKYFRVYVLHSKIIAYVPSIAMKEILIQLDTDGRRRIWITKILEFDVEMKPTKLIKGQGLAKLLDEENYRYLGVNFAEKCSEDQQVELSNTNVQANPPLVGCPWYKDVIYFLLELKPPDGIGKIKARDLKLKAVIYYLIDHVLHWRDPLGVLMRCLNP